MYPGGGVCPWPAVRKVMSEQQERGLCCPGEPHGAWAQQQWCQKQPPPLQASLSPFCFGSCLFRTTTSSDYDIRPSEERRDVGFYCVPVQCGPHACCHCPGEGALGRPSVSQHSPTLGWSSPDMTMVGGDLSLLCHLRLLESQSSTVASW